MNTRENILKCLGNFPEKDSLNITEINSKDMGDYEIKLLENIGINIEDKEYTNEELRRYENQIEDFIMNHSTKNGDISKLSN